MLQIIHGDETANPTQTYAHTRWLENPSISAAYWHEVLGHTLGKIALDARTAFTQPELLPQGINLIITSPATHVQVQHAIAQLSFAPETLLTAHVTTTPTTIPPATTYLIWEIPPSITEATAVPVLAGLENAVRQGQLQAYGILDADLTAPDTLRPLHHWLEWAATAAQQIHQRRKRPALQVIALTLDLLNLSAVTVANTLHKEEPVSPLELISRLGLAAIALSPTIPSLIPSSAQTLQILTTAAEAEHAFNMALGGWPAINGQPLFSILAALGQGAPPWPTPHHWQHWQRHLWPVMQTFLAGHPLPQAAQLAAAVQNLLPLGPSLALAAAQPALTQQLATVAANLPANWAAQPAPVLNAALLSSIPGLAALALPSVEGLQHIQKLGNFPDPAILFSPAPHLS